MTTFISLAAPHVEIKYKEKVYKLCALTFKDFAEYVLWYQFKELRDAEYATKNLDDSIKEPILKEAYSNCVKKCFIWKDEHGVDQKAPLSWEQSEVQESLNSVEGIAYQLFLSLRHNHPDVTEQLADEIVTLQTYQQILGKILIVQGLSPEENKEKDNFLGEVKSLNQ